MGGGGGAQLRAPIFFKCLYISKNAVHYMFVGVQDQSLGKSLVSIENSVHF